MCLFGVKNKYLLFALTVLAKVSTSLTVLNQDISLEPLYKQLFGILFRISSSKSNNWFLDINLEDSLIPSSWYST